MGNGDLLTTFGVTLGKVALFVAFMLIVGRRVFPWMLWQVARTGSRELFTLCVIAAAVGIAYGSAEIFGVSFALGAFFAGMVLRESSLSHRAAEESLPLRDAFSVLFFVSVGMLFDPAMLVREPLHVLVVVAIIMIGKTLAALLLVLAFRYPLNTALTVSASLAQIGEFSFILASLGVSLQLLPAEGQSLILAGALISIALNPLMFNAIEPVQRWIRARSAVARAMERRDDPLAELPMTVNQNLLTNHVVIVGYGRVGQRIAERVDAAADLDRGCGAESRTGRATAQAEHSRRFGRRVGAGSADPGAHRTRADAGDCDSRYVQRSQDHRNRAYAEAEREDRGTHAQRRRSGAAAEGQCRRGVHRRTRTGAGDDAPRGRTRVGRSVSRRIRVTNEGVR